MLTKTEHKFSEKFRARLRDKVIDELRARGLPTFLRFGRY